MLSSLWRHRAWLIGVADAVGIVASFLLAFYIRFKLHIGLREIPTAQYSDIWYVKGALGTAVIWMFLIWRDGGYKTGLAQSTSRLTIIRALAVNAGSALGVMMVISFMSRDFLLSRQVFLTTGILGLISTIAIRLIVGGLDRPLGRRGIGAERVAVVGSLGEAERFAERLRARGGTIQLVGFLEWNAPTNGGDDDGSDASAVRRLGSIDDLDDVRRSVEIDHLVIPSSEDPESRNEPSGERLIQLLNYCEANSLSLHRMMDEFDVAVIPEEVGSFDGVPLILLRDATWRRSHAIVKRLVDIVGSVVLIVVGLPAWVAVAVLVKLSGRGPIFFVQSREGLYGTPFRMYKFRSMVVDAEERLKDLVDLDNLEEPVFKIESDPRVTKVGRILRRTGLDEIPQLWNVLKGEMSLVGPRPEETSMTDRYTPWQWRRLKAKPGITGLQQVECRGGVSLAERVKYDLYYLKYKSLFLDIYIIFRTVGVIFRGGGVSH